MSSRRWLAAALAALAAFARGFLGLPSHAGSDASAARRALADAAARRDRCC